MPVFVVAVECAEDVRRYVFDHGLLVGKGYVVAGKVAEFVPDSVVAHVVHSIAHEFLCYSFGLRWTIKVQGIVNLEEHLRFRMGGGVGQGPERLVYVILNGEHHITGGGLNGEVQDLRDHGLSVALKDLLEFMPLLPCVVVEMEVGERAGVTSERELEAAVCLGGAAKGVLPGKQGGEEKVTVLDDFFKKCFWK